MKQLVNFIVEKLRIDKNINIDNKDIKIKFEEDKVDFPDGDVVKIIDYAKSLPISPNEIEYLYNSNAIRLRYNVNNNPAKLKYGIIFSFISTAKKAGYRVAFLDDATYMYEYPEFPKVISLDDSFEYVDKKFDNVIKE